MITDDSSVELVADRLFTIFFYKTLQRFNVDCSLHLLYPNPIEYLISSFRFYLAVAYLKFG